MKKPSTAEISKFHAGLEAEIGTDAELLSPADLEYLMELAHTADRSTVLRHAWDIAWEKAVAEYEPQA